MYQLLPGASESVLGVISQHTNNEANTTPHQSCFYNAEVKVNLKKKHISGFGRISFMVFESIEP